MDILGTGRFELGLREEQGKCQAFNLTQGLKSDALVVLVRSDPPRASQGSEAAL